MAYSALDTSRDLIRLMHLAPASHAEEKVICRFTTVSLAEAPLYEALSYVWSESLDTQSHVVSVENVSIAITDNLHAALSRLRLRDRERTLWVDALCINQSDLKEKSHQVSRMASVFGKASLVIVWLGAGWDWSDIAMECLRVTAGDASLHLDPSISPYITVGELDLNSNDLVGHMIRFFKLPWWGRTWTVQEFVLAPELILQCGTSIITREKLFEATKNFWGHKDRCCTSRTGGFNSVHLEYDETLTGAYEVPDKLKFVTNARGGSYSVLDAISSFSKNGVTNARDRIYGMLGLGTGNYANLVQPDYNLSPEQVCEALVRRSIERTGKLEVFSHIYGHNNPNLPSFVPDWTGKFQWEELYSSRISNVEKFSAARDTQAKISTESAGVLAARGVLFDTIVDTCPASVINMLYNTDYLISLCELTGLEDSSQELYCHTDESRWLAFWHTLNGGMEDFVDEVGRRSRRLKGSKDLTNCAKLKDVIRNFPPHRRSENFDTDLIRNLLVIETATLGRHFFTTEGGYFGLGPQRCVSGDIVAVLSGGRVPYVMRPAPPRQSEKCFTILGDSYVHGIMDGELLDPRSGISREIEDIVLI